MAKPDKTDLLNAYVARSMSVWAKATIDLHREHQRKDRRKPETGMRAVKLPSAIAD